MAIIVTAEDILLLNLLFIVLLHFFDLGYSNPSYYLLHLVVNLGYMLGLTVTRIKDAQSLRISNIISQNFVRLSILLLVLLLSLFAQKISEDISRFFVFTFLGSAFVLLCLSHWITKKVLIAVMKSNRYNDKTIILGAGLLGNKLYSELTDNLHLGIQVLGFFDDDPALQHHPHILGTVEEAKEYALTHSVTKIYCTLPMLAKDKILDFSDFSEKNVIKYFIVPAVGYYTETPLVLSSVGNMPVFSVRRIPLSSMHNAFLKRTFDVIFSLLFLITLFPIIYLVLAIAIKLTSPGPVFFVQERTGRRGETFNCYKFRSMRCNGEAHTKQATHHDARITCIGRFMRATNFDELPQFLNVLKGNMSVVGPRPHMLQHTDYYSQLVNKYMVRHFIKPGVTGLAQISGFRGETKQVEQMEGRIKKDLWYLENWSFLLDIEIILKTIAVTIAGDKKAY